MVEPDSSRFFASDHSLSRDAPEVMQAFVSRHRPFFVLVAVMLSQILLLSVQITRNQNVRLIQVWAVEAFDPFERMVSWTVDKGGLTWKNYIDLRNTWNENQELRSELDTAEAQVRVYSEKAAETDRLRALLNFKNAQPFQTVAAEVIASSPGERARAVFIDKGEDAGLKPDLAVLTPDGIVGKTIAVFPRSAQVLLITDPTSGVGCILEQSRVQGVLKGGGRHLATLQYVMNGEKISVGERILTSGLDQIYPKGLPVGTVLEKSDGAAYQKILVKPTAQLDRLETVLVALKPNASSAQSQTNSAKH